MSLFWSPTAQAGLSDVYAALEPQSWKELREPAGFIHDVAVEESNRGTGVATALVEAAMKPVLRRDYQAMRDMYLSEPTELDRILSTLADLELRINSESQE